MAYKVKFEPDALRMLGTISDRRIRAIITRRANRLVEEPEKQGKPLSRSMLSYRTVRAVGQRYRIIYRVDRSRELVQVIAVGLRRGSGKKDVYSMAERVAERARRFPSDQESFAMYVEDEYDVELIPLAKACEMLDELPEILGKDNRTAALTVDGKPVLAVLPWHVYESVVESLDIMEDPEMVDALRKSMDGIPEEDLISIEEVSARLDG